MPSASPDRPLPAHAAWRHDGAGNGFEVTFFRPLPTGGTLLAGHTAAVEDREAYAVRYEIEVDDRWRTLRARAWAWTGAGDHEVTVESDGAGHWLVNGRPRHELDGCHDIDVEASACTNTLPIHRLALDVGEGADVPAAYVRSLDLRLERLEQHYRRAPDEGDRRHFDYESPRFDYAGRLTYDTAGLILDYPGIATRAF